ncbi:MAG: DUF4339 domain-containing protein [Tannerella sp.]|jgi:hypothetical protein|nr:DUF4339 domain-containing protein [Tannerella sp.]
MEKEYFYLTGTTRVGPLSLDELKRASITSATYVWNHTLPEWTAARMLPELAGMFAAPPPPPPASAFPPAPGYSTGGGRAYSAGGYYEAQSNGIGIAGFVIALVAVFLSWIPVLGWILWLLGLILSCAGLLKNPKGLAIAGFVISLIDLVVLICVMAGIAALITALIAAVPGMAGAFL